MAAYLAGDGSVKAGGFSASTTSAGLRDDLQRLALELGWTCSWSPLHPAKPEHSQCYQLNMLPGRMETSLYPRNMGEARYSGEVFCLTVPTGAYFVRRNGKAVVCGNSANWYNKADHGIVVHRPKPTSTTSHVSTRKVRFQPDTGRPGTQAFMFNVVTKRFEEMPDELGFQTERAA